MSLPVILIGGGGHAKVLAEVLRRQSISILGIVDIKEVSFCNLPFLGSDEVVLKHKPNQVQLVNGIGSIDSTVKRKSIFEKFKNQGYSFANVIHPSAQVAFDIELGEGVQIMAGAIIQPGTKLGADSIVNTNSSVDHDSTIGAHAHIAPGVTICGGVTIGEGCHIGTGATIVQNVHIEAETFVRAGLLVSHNLLTRKPNVIGFQSRQI